MDKYEIIVDALDKKLKNGEITEEAYSEVSDLAYLDYICERYITDDLTLDEFNLFLDDYMKESASDKIKEELGKELSNYKKYMETIKRHYTVYKKSEDKIRSLIKEKKFEEAAKEIQVNISAVRGIQTEIDTLKDGTPTKVLIYTKNCITSMVRTMNMVATIIGVASASYVGIKTLDKMTKGKPYTGVETITKIDDNTDIVKDHRVKPPIDDKTKKAITVGVGLTAAAITAMKVKNTQIKTGNVGQFKTTAKVCLSKEIVRLEKMKVTLVKEFNKSSLKTIKKDVNKEVKKETEKMNKVKKAQKKDFITNINLKNL